MSTVEGENLIAGKGGVLETVSTLAAQIKGLRAVNAQENPKNDDLTEQTDFSDQFRLKWKAIDTALDDVFGDLDGADDADTDYDHIDALATTGRLGLAALAEMIETLDKIVAALSSEDGFLAAAADDGIFEGSTAGGAKAATVAKNATATFNAIASTATVHMARTANTRFGVYSKESTDTADVKLASDSMGAYAYSPMKAAKFADLPQAGAAEYNGRTMAMSMDGKTVYNGDISLQVRFRGKRVSGLVENLLDGDGDAFTYGFGTVAAIILAEATIGNDGDFMKDAERTSQIVFTAEPGSPQATILANREEDDGDGGTNTVQGSSFAGQFVGDGAAAIGTWAIDASTNDAENLTAAFGAEKGADVPETAPTVSGGGIAMTSLLTNGNPVNAKTGVITIVPRNPLTGTPLVSAAVTVKGADLFDSGGAVMDGDAFVAEAIKEINSLLERLNAFIALDELEDETSADAGRLAVWGELATAINMVVGDMGAEIFNDDGYSEGNNDPDDDDRDAAAKDIIADVLAALSSKTAFRAAVDEDGALYGDTGIISGNNAAKDAIFARVASKTTIEYGSTTYTRFGAWNRVASTNATVDPVAPSDNANGRFAYSPLPATAYATNDPNFPLGGKATYEGTTIARSTTAGDNLNTYYEGTIEVDVRWGTDLGTAGQDATVGTISASVSNLRTDKGVLYVSGVDDGTNPDGNGVETILFTADDINVTRAGTGNTLSFGVTIRLDLTQLSACGTRISGNRTSCGSATAPSPASSSARSSTARWASSAPGVWTGFTGADNLEGVYGADLAP